MKLSDLKPFIEPPPIERESCHACRTLTPDCLVPVGDESVPMCWLCAHHVVEHGTTTVEAQEGECECLPHEIYPHRAPTPAGPEPTPTQRRLVRFEHGDVDYTKPRTKEELLRGSSLSDAVAASVKVSSRLLLNGCLASVSAVREDTARLKAPKRPKP